ncbi:NAD(P)H-dependent oxidoreductase [Oscillospiraceae bacterium WX1]
MNITVVNGNMRHGSTWHAAAAVVKALTENTPAAVTEFFLPRDMMHFCTGCFSCIQNGEHTCPHAASVAPIVKALLSADVIILTSPVYGMAVSGQMKVLLDHLCFMWMSHRPSPQMFQKVALVVTTTAGAGLGRAAKTMTDSLTYWGVQKVFTLKAPVAAMCWQDVKEKRQNAIQKRAIVLAQKIRRAVKNIDQLPNPLFRSFFFYMMKGMMKKNTWNMTDKAHWEANGWLEGVKPF